MVWVLMATIVLLGMISILYFKIRSKLFILESENQKLLSENKYHIDKSLALASELEGLSKYKGILDAEKRAEEILRLAATKAQELEEIANNKVTVANHQRDELVQEGFKTSQRLKEQAQKIVDDANSEAQKIKLSAQSEKQLIVNQTNNEVHDLKLEAKHKLSQANIEADLIIKKAEEEAKQIAGQAYESMKKVDSLEKTAKALKNIVEGYGDQYIVPTYSLLDKLAEDYSHTKAGEDLKKAREKMRAMIKDKRAADCDYVEANRKDTAIDFVLDAFNGKVDTILASVKEDNFGTLSQKIKDAFHTVNANGAAFRSARITDKYLKVRLEELQLACTVQALKEKDKEEQRRIKEQLREEEKAVREYEKALKEAQKEQETVNKAIDKVRKDLEEASEQKKKFYEEKLQELEMKLSEAEEKNKRAQSMAELTKSGHVYIISNVGSFGEDILKIGMTRRLDPMDRVYELGDASVPFEFDVHALIYSEDAPGLEKELHKKFMNSQVNKVNARKEFFNVGVMELRNEIEKLGFQVQWTMQAEAREFRESQAIASKKSHVA